MHVAHLEHGNKAGKFALVAGLHALAAIGIINLTNGKVLSLPRLPADLTVFMPPKPVEPPPPPEPPAALPRALMPPVTVPQVEVELPPLPPDSPVQASTEPAPPQEPAQPHQAEARQAATPSANSGAIRSAVLADAGSCAKPAYPAKAARNGETGTVTLALLVGADGRVTASRVQASSGSRELDRAAVNALSLCQFKPAFDNGVPQAGWTQIAYVWSLE